MDWRSLQASYASGLHIIWRSGECHGARIRMMGLTLLLGFAGTLLFFYGLRYIFSLIIKGGKRDVRLHVFNVRQLQENVVRKSATMAVSSLLILGALCCFGAGVSISVNYGQSESHVLDYTFIPEYTDGPNQEKTAEDILDTLHKEGLDTEFSRLFKMRSVIYAQQISSQKMI